MISMKVDNDDGAINWENRSHTVVILGLMVGRTLDEIENDPITVKNPELHRFVKEKCQRIRERKAKECNTPTASPTSPTSETS